ncbi:hypothetical protein PG985_009447 [Apiospora marii]|uniref:uncharacterized protein n=1 Tax=Apiospora marii TaxID=335849 RepID=UPI00312DE392
MGLTTDWSPLSDFSLLGIFAMLLTLLIIDITKQTIPGYTFLLLFFNYYAAKVALEVAADKYPKVKDKIQFLSTRTPMACNIQDGFMLDEIQEAIDQSQIPEGFDSNQIRSAIEQSKKQEAIDQQRIWNAIKRGQQNQGALPQDEPSDDDLQAAIAQSNDQQAIEQGRILATIQSGQQNQEDDVQDGFEDALQQAIEQSKRQEVTDQERILAAIQRGQQNQRGPVQDGFAQDDLNMAMEQSQAQAIIQHNRMQAAALDQELEATTESNLNWQRVYSMLEDLTLYMARSRLIQLRGEEHPSKLLVGATQNQVKALTSILRDVEKGRDYRAAFFKFIEIEPSSQWVKTLEDFLTPRPTSYAELLFACLEKITADNIDCLEGAAVYKDRPFTMRFIQIKRILDQQDSESRLQLLEDTQELVKRATTPRLREDLFLTLTARTNGMQSLERAIDLAQALTPEALTGFRHNLSAGSWPRWLVPLLESADAVLDQAKFDSIMQNTAVLLREVQRLTVQNYVQLRDKISSADNQVRMIQQQVVRNWRILVAKPRWNRADFTASLVPACKFNAIKASDVVESLFLGYLEALETPEHGTYSVPDAVKELSFLQLIKLNNLIVKQPNMPGLESQIITLQPQDDGREPPPFTDSVEDSE